MRTGDTPSPVRTSFYKDLLIPGPSPVLLPVMVWSSVDISAFAQGSIFISSLISLVMTVLIHKLTGNTHQAASEPVDMNTLI